MSILVSNKIKMVMGNIWFKEISGFVVAVVVCLTLFSIYQKGIVIDTLGRKTYEAVKESKTETAIATEVSPGEFEVTQAEDLAGNQSVDFWIEQFDKSNEKFIERLVVELNKMLDEKRTEYLIEKSDHLK